MGMEEQTEHRFKREDIPSVPFTSDAEASAENRFNQLDDWAENGSDIRESIEPIVDVLNQIWIPLLDNRNVPGTLKNVGWNVVAPVVGPV
jgi:hypothetical protein